MTVIDPGHVYDLASLDGGEPIRLTFVKRCEPPERYPGNYNAHPGTTLQEVMRALIERCGYVNGQIPCAETQAVAGLLETAILLLEVRAARVHNRSLDLAELAGIDRLPTCSRCGHVDCEHAAGPAPARPEPGAHDE